MRLSSLERLWFIEFKFELHGKYEILKIININLRDSLTLIFPPVTTVHPANLCLIGFANATFVFLSHFLGNKLDFKPYNSSASSLLCYT
jgi:hypothetical protein